MIRREHTMLGMGTIIHLRVVTDVDTPEVNHAITAAQEAFARVEAVCSRYDEGSELRQLSLHVGEPIPVSDILFETLQFALAVAEETGGLFDPTVGRILHAHGFTRHYLTGHTVADESASPGAASYRDVVLDTSARTVCLARPLTLDLGAVAKGFAVDLAAQILRPFTNFLIDAGGDVYVAGHNDLGQPWQVGIRHPAEPEGVIATLQVTDMAICTSGGYERKSPLPGLGHHLVDPSTGQSPGAVCSSTVMAPFAMMADAFSTVTYLLGIRQSMRLVESLDLHGLWVDDQLQVHMSKGMREYCSDACDDTLG